MIALWRNGIISFVYLVQSAKPCCEIHAKRRCGYPQEEMADLSGKTTYTPSYPRYPQVFGDVDKQKLWKLKERMFCEVVLNCHFFCNYSAFDFIVTKSAYSRFAFGKEAGFFSTFMHSHGLCSKCKDLG